MINDISVAGSGLLSFAEDISERERSTVIYAIRHAQQAASDLYEQQSSADWFEFFCRQLRFLGWDAAPPSEPFKPNRGRQRVLEAAVEKMRERDPHFHSLAVAGVQALQADEPGLLLFERYARRHHYGMFQLLPCARSRLASGVGVVDLLVYHEELDMRDTSPCCLIKDTPPPAITARLQLVRVDTRALEATWLPKIKARFVKPWEDGTYMRLLTAP